MRRVCVFCGSRVGNREVYAASARHLGRLFAERKLGLVYGAGHIGMMGILADAALAAGAEVIGVIPRGLVEKELAHTRLSALHVVETMHQRKALMSDLTDGFIALPGAYGTADEFFEILTWAQLGIHTKPIGLLNISGYFDMLLGWIDLAVQEGFLHARNRHLLMVESDPVVLLDALQAYRAPETPRWIDPRER